MAQPNRLYFTAVLALLSVALFAALWLPNATASQDLGMVLAFEPDEVIPFPYLQDMLQPRDSLKHTVANFFAYEYYFYGFPYFAYSAFLLLPLKWLGQLDNIPLVMAVLRNFVSVFPMLASIWLLVYLHTRFNDYRAIVLFVFLALVPGVMYNNFWWHPDSMAILFAMLTLFFLMRDDLRFGRNFYLAAAACGLSAQTKLIGVYFFLAVLVYLWHGYRAGRGLRQLLLAAAGFLAVMVAAFFASNPILLYAGARSTYFNTLSAQSGLMAEGFELQYAKGLPEVTRMLRDNFGGWLLLAASALAAGYAAVRRPQPLLYRLILAWVLPLAVYVFGFSIVKYQYWLPAALPLLSCLVIALPHSRAQAAEWWGRQRAWALLAVGVLAVWAFSAAGMLPHTLAIYRSQLTRQASHPALAFYAEARAQLEALPPAAYHVYADVNLYIPESSGWVRSAQFETLTYEYIASHGFDLLFLSQSRILDYLNEDAVGTNPEQLALSREFYAAANAGELDGFRLVFRSNTGLVFVSDGLYAQYFGE
ncbi:MAG: hypothetical protein KF698_04295 [Anaerolineales bacterium]|nr:hypothetical protein [Anaerolineales bacterium]